MAVWNKFDVGMIKEQFNEDKGSPTIETVVRKKKVNTMGSKLEPLQGSVVSKKELESNVCDHKSMGSQVSLLRPIIRGSETHRVSHD